MPMSIISFPLSFLLAVILGLIGLSTATSVHAQQTLEEFETQLDMTIRSACHGYMIDAVPDLFADMRGWLNENTPFCQTVRTLREGESAAHVFMEALKTEAPVKSRQFESQFRRLWDPSDPIFSECQDWMCQHIRTEQQQRQNPVSLADYQLVEKHCEGSYGCIEDWFSAWPRTLPEAGASGLSLDGLMTEPAATEQRGGSVGLSLDNLMSGQPANASLSNSGIASGKSEVASKPEISLDNIHAAREALKLDALGRRLVRSQAGLRSLCDCSLSATGCYQLPSKDLLDAAGSIEDQRVGLCRNAGLDFAPQPATLEEGQSYEQVLAATDKQVRALDNEMQTRVSQWQREHERRLAKQRQEQQDRSDAAFLAGMATIVGGAGLVNDGMVSAEQLATVAAQVTKDVEVGRSVTSSIGSAVGKVSSRVSSTQSSNSSYNAYGTQSQANDGVYEISCYNAAQMICIDYTVYKQSQYQQFRQQCSIAPNKIISGGCSREGASCTLDSPRGKTVMFTYTVAAETVQRQCSASQGTFKHY